MVSELSSYSGTKSTGLPWVPTIPSHWGLKPNRTLMRRKKKLVGENHKDYSLLSLTKAGVIIRDVSTGKGKFSVDMGTYQEVNRGDLIFCLFDVPETPRTVGLSSHYGMITGAYTVFECRDPRMATYVELFYKAMDDRKLLSPLYSGLRNTIPPPKFLGTKTPVPPLTEQVAIVRFLEYVDRRIYKYLRAKEKLIKLIEEQKQAIIHRTVTRGLNPDVPLKPSGVEWLGDVPERWEVRRNGRLFTQRNETGFANLPILEVSLRTGVRVRDFENSYRKQVMSDRDKYKRALRGDIAYNMMRMWQGAVGVVPTDGLISPAYVVAKPMLGTESRYFIRLFRTGVYMTEVDKFSRGIVKDRNRLYWEDFKRMPSCYPPPHEQVEIADAIDEVSKNIDATIDHTLKEIDFLREYRSRLIEDVVTGKLDVRKVAAKLPEKSEEPKELTEAKDMMDSAEVIVDKLGHFPEEAEA